jgi:hypothetical protein
MAVRIVTQRESREQPETDYVRVSTCSDPLDDTVTLATIQRFVEKQRRDGASRGVHVKTLVMRKPMSSNDALGFATRYAERKNIPVVYTDD